MGTLLLVDEHDSVIVSRMLPVVSVDDGARLTSAIELLLVFVINNYFTFSLFTNTVCCQQIIHFVLLTN